MIREKWKIQCLEFNLNNKGFGHAVYSLETKKGTYRAIFFTKDILPEQRNDRVIAEEWDMCCCLWKGGISKEQIENLSQNLPQQESGRYNSNVFSVSRANKSMRLFEYIANCLAEGNQPDQAEMKNTGYLVRTTGVYGNGKFGMADYQYLIDTDFSEQFSAQLFLVYMVRLFTIDLIEHIAYNRNPNKATKLNSQAKQFLGTGNSTGLGMAPYLVKHPHIVNSWISQREQALHEIIETVELTAQSKDSCAALIKKGIAYFEDVEVPDPIQSEKNKTLASELKEFASVMHSIEIDGTNWKSAWQIIEKSNFSPDTEELVLNILLEIYPHISEHYDSFNHVSNKESSWLGMNIRNLLKELEQGYCWAIDIDFTKPENQHYFWYRSEEKAEPRLGIRDNEQGDELEMKIDIARQMRHLYLTLQTFVKDTPDMSVSELALRVPEVTGAIQRLLGYSQFRFGEIRKNILSQDLYPIDILRLKLSFFGAVKFDPKSDKWLRVTLFQGAPLPDDNGIITSPDNWFLYRYTDAINIP